jgi:hypothetical protein
MNKTKKGYVCPYTELYIVECPELGIFLPMKVPASNKKSFTIEFGGLKRYDDKSERMQELLWDLIDDLQYCRINRIDIAMDIRNRIPGKVHKALLKVNRHPKKYKNSIYYKTLKEKKSNPVVNILMYNKGKKNGFTTEKKCMRLEFQFRLRFFNGMHFCNIKKAILKIEKRIKKDTHLKIKVCDDLV